jgi:SAM-dependent methyltransferase
MTESHPCRFCGNKLKHTFVDLGSQPVANDLISMAEKDQKEPFFPLHVYVCEKCWLVQIPSIRREHEIFTDHYPYFSSFSSTWLKHSKAYTDMIIKRLNLNTSQLVIELASNDGYLLQYFKEQNIPVLGIEPTSNTAAAAEAKGIPTLVEFFGVDIAEDLTKKGQQADLLIGNNVLAHVPDLNDFVAGMKVLLKPSGVITIEFPHLMQMIARNQFDTIYHEHYSYYSFLAVEKIFAAHGLTLFDVEEIPTHGGSLRIYGKHADNDTWKLSDNVEKLKAKEIEAGLQKIETYEKFGQQVEDTKAKLLAFLKQLKAEGKKIIGYGAAAKGITLTNSCGITTEFLDYTVDANPAKQNHFLPGSRIPIYPPDKIKETKPDYVLILPWNLRQEISTDHSYIKDWNGKFFVAIPTVEVLA